MNSMLMFGKGESVLGFEQLRKSELSTPDYEFKKAKSDPYQPIKHEGLIFKDLSSSLSVKQ